MRPFRQPHRARVVGGEWEHVRTGRDDDDGSWVWERATGQIQVDDPEDLARAVAPAEVEIDFGRFGLFVRRHEDRTLFRGTIDDTIGPEDRDEEVALWKALTLAGDDVAPRACFFCKWSDVEASSGIRNLGCLVDRATEYEAYVAAHHGTPRMKWVSNLVGDWVDAFDTCDRFTLRPIGFGYRGRSR